jgi:uncharacterized protein (UPF0333 family)
MGRQYLLVALLAACLLLTGSTQTYVHTFDSSGKSFIEEKKDLSSYIQSYPNGSLDRLRNACSATPALGCSVDGTIMTLRLEMAPDSGYYTFKSEYGLPFITSTVTVEKIPSDQFDAALNRALVAVDLTTSRSSAKPLDLRDSATNAQLAAAWKSVGMNETYTIVMPDGHSETYDLVALLADSKPMAVAVQELNLGVLTLLAGVLVLAAFAGSFFFTKKKKKAGKR